MRGVFIECDDLDAPWSDGSTYAFVAPTTIDELRDNFGEVHRANRGLTGEGVPHLCSAWFVIHHRQQRGSIEDASLTLGFRSPLSDQFVDE